MCSGLAHMVNPDLNRRIDMRNLILISCSSQKTQFAGKAKDLYQSDLFRKSFEFAKQQLAPLWIQNQGPDDSQIFILSAKYGLVDPHSFIFPYDESLNFMTPEKQQLWGNIVFKQLLNEYPGSEYPSEIYFLCGRNYRMHLLPQVADHFYRSDIKTPLAGLGIGQQKQWLKTQIQNELDPGFIS